MATYQAKTLIFSPSGLLGATPIPQFKQVVSSTSATQLVFEGSDSTVTRVTTTTTPTVTVTRRRSVQTAAERTLPHNHPNVNRQPVLAEDDELFQSFAGSDIKAIVTYTNAIGRHAQRVIGSLESFTVMIKRNTTPLYRVGSYTPASFARGNRIISGTLVFSVFDRDPILKDVIVTDEFTRLFYQWSRIANTKVSTIQRQQTITSALNNIAALMQKERIRYPDQIAPFDITFSMINDQGAASYCAVRRVYLVSEGIGLSMDSLQTNQTYTYIARAYEPLQPIVGTNRRISYDAFSD